MKSYNKYILAGLFFFILYSPAIAEESAKIKEHRRKVVLVIQEYIKKIFSENKETDIEDKKVNKFNCEKCKDTKFITHGDGHKTACPFCAKGDMLGSSPVKIYFYTIDSCTSCKQWESQERPLFSEYEIIQINETNSVNKKFKRYPSFEIQFPKKTVQITGYLSKDLMEKINEQHNR